MLKCLTKTTVMSVDEFLMIERGQTTLKIVRQNHNGEEFINKIMKNKRFEKFAVALVGCGLYFQNAYGVAQSTKGPEYLGRKLLNLFREWAGPILILMCIIEIVLNAAKGDSKKTLSILMKYLLIYASMYIVPEVFLTIKRSFE